MKVVRAILLSLLVSFLVGLAIGFAIRSRLDEPVAYIGLAAPTHPLDVARAGPPVLDPRNHEEQVRESVHIAQG